MTGHHKGAKIGTADERCFHFVVDRFSVKYVGIYGSLDIEKEQCKAMF